VTEAARQRSCTTIASAVLAWVPLVTEPSVAEIGSVLDRWVPGNVASCKKEHTLAVRMIGARVRHMLLPCPGPKGGVIPSLSEMDGWHRWATAAPDPCMRADAGLAWQTYVSGDQDERFRCHDDPRDLHDQIWHRLGGACAHPSGSGLGNPARPPDGSMECLC